MLGLEKHSWLELGSHLLDLSLGFGNVYDAARLAGASRAMATLERWIGEAAQSKRTRPALFLDRLLALQETGMIAGPAQLSATAILFVQAGQDTTSALIANGILTLLKHPQHIARLIAEPDFAPQVVEEVLRFESPVQQTIWHASEPLEISGVPVEKGNGVTFLLGAANRDPEVFENPEEFDPTVQRPRTAAFGFGPHACPGADFGRQTAAASLRAFFQKFPKARLVNETPTWKPLAIFRSVTELFVET